MLGRGQKMDAREYDEFLDMEFERQIQNEQRHIEGQNERFNQAETNYINSHIKWSNQDG